MPFCLEKLPRRLPCSLIALLALNSAPLSLAFQSDGLPSLESIRDVTFERTSSLSSVQLQWSSERVIARGFLSTNFAFRQREGDVEPPRDTKLNGIGSLALKGKSRRFDYEFQVWDAARQAPSSLSRQNAAFHGGEGRYVYFDSEDSDNPHRPEAGRTADPPSGDAGKEGGDALSLFYMTPETRESQFVDYLDPTRYEVLRRETTLSGEVVVVGDTDRRIEVYLDPTRKYLPVRLEDLKHDGSVQSLFEIAYVADSVAGWVPAGAVWIERSGGLARDRDVIENVNQVLVTDLTLNEPIDDSHFEIEFPDGARVTDDIDGGWYYVGLPAIEETPIEETPALDREPQAQPPSPSPSSSANRRSAPLVLEPEPAGQSGGYGRMLLGIGLVGMGALLIATFFYLRRRP